jgi:hypothetical protein
MKNNKRGKERKKERKKRKQNSKSSPSRTGGGKSNIIPPTELVGERL